MESVWKDTPLENKDSQAQSTEEGLEGQPSRERAVPGEDGTHSIPETGPLKES